MAIKAFYCAFEKGKFWDVHALLMSEKGYEIQNGTDPAGTASTGPVVKNDKTKSGDLANFLSSAIDPAFMKSCLDSGKYDARIGADTQLASGLGVQGTPGFFVNATNFAGAYSFKDMQSAVDAALK
jgi:protein-disulfide isomerase